VCGLPTTPKILDCLSVRCAWVRRGCGWVGGAERDLKSEVLWVRMLEVRAARVDCKGCVSVHL
jgi:hypothetical protein